MESKVIQGAFGLFDYSIGLGALGIIALAFLILFVNERRINQRLTANMNDMHIAHTKEIKEMQKAQLENNANHLQQTTVAFDRVHNVLETVREILRMQG